jgi:intein-encoded DNA endonuclease-like protein
MDPTILAYIAGFLDGDGSIFFQLVRRKGYIYGYQVRCSIAFYQKSKNARILRWLKSIFKCGYIRHRKTGISDYTIVESEKVKNILQSLKPYVRLKQKHINLGVEILEKLSRINGARSFLEVCRLVDCFQELNYSKKRTVSSKEIEEFLKRHNYLTPVETSPLRRELSHL